MAPTKTGAPENTKQSETKKATRVYNTPMIDEFTDKYWDLICLPLLGFGLLLFGILLVIVGIVYKIEDLIILGCLLGTGCFVFFFLMYTAICRPRCQRNMVTSFDLDKVNERQATSGSELSVPPDYAYYNIAYESKGDVIKERVVPSEQQLYGDKMRSFMATPATTKDVTFFEDAGTPPPPRVALPCAPGDKSKMVTSMDFEEMMASNNKAEVSSIELM